MSRTARFAGRASESARSACPRPRRERGRRASEPGAERIGQKLAGDLLQRELKVVLAQVELAGRSRQADPLERYLRRSAGGATPSCARPLPRTLGVTACGFSSMERELAIGALQPRRGRRGRSRRAPCRAALPAAGRSPGRRLRPGRDSAPPSSVTWSPSWRPSSISTSRTCPGRLIRQAIAATKAVGTTVSPTSSDRRQGLAQRGESGETSLPPGLLRDHVARWHRSGSIHSRRIDEIADFAQLDFAVGRSREAHRPSPGGSPQWASRSRLSS